MKRRDQYFTVVFEGDIRDLEHSPMNMKTKFGKVVAAGRGNAFDVEDHLRDLLIRKGPTGDEWL